MSTFKSISLLSLLAILALGSQVAQAHGRGGWHGGVGVYFGNPYPFFPYGYAPYAYPYPYAYSPPPVVITQPQPQVYIEQGNTSPAPAASAPSASTQSSSAYWYYCEQSDSYYPYVKDCPAGWKQVTPTPPASGSTR